MRKHILVPTDGSQNANLALKEAIFFAKQLDEKIILLHVQMSMSTIHTRRFFNEEEIHAYENQLSDEALAPALDLLKETNVSYEVKKRTGNPKEEILKEAQEGQIRTIVVGAKGTGAIIGSLLGSVAHGLVQHAPCPVMVVPNRALHTDA
ncbi:universal stress protein [Hazenella sp. IB182357]|uniref:Universal stress protein n=1 Tax=Polycladospora coralii TaxID=2771432 RepID=A0A926RUY8_9BACL|nr:universal stress protein [Polycladospora coralii]MBD1373573.1 universal stress protein [Polycladospora coralii]MBS7531946.1 universal stress protein [Polycladospora coralii]